MYNNWVVWGGMKNENMQKHNEVKYHQLKKLGFEQCNSVFLKTMQKYAGEYLILLINKK